MALPDDENPPSGPLVGRWSDPAVLAAGVVALAAGFGQFGPVAVLGDVARSFGRVSAGVTIADRAGLSGTELGIGLAVVRIASLGGLGVAGLADRLGRRAVVLTACALGLVFTVGAAGSPSYWWFVAVVACARPLLSAAGALTQVTAAELTASAGRAKAIALTTAAYGAGSGLVAIVHGTAGGTLGFRGVFVFAAAPLAALFLVGRRMAEPDRYVRASAVAVRPLPVLGAVGPTFRRRLLVVVSVAFAVSVVTGPANSFLFVYSHNVLGLSGFVTSAMVTAAGASGLAGLLVGRWMADHIGRRPTAAGAMVAVALFGVLTYGGSGYAAVAGYVLGVMAGAAFAPAAGSLVNELFPTSVRASVAGWQVAGGVLGAVVGLLVFGAVADAGHRFAPAALVTFLPVAGVSVLFGLVPETKGREPEDLWPEGQ